MRKARRSKGATYSGKSKRETQHEPQLIDTAQVDAQANNESSTSGSIQTQNQFLRRTRKRMMDEDTLLVKTNTRRQKKHVTMKSVNVGSSVEAKLTEKTSLPDESQNKSSLEYNMPDTKNEQLTPSVNKHFTPLHLAARNGSRSGIEYLIKNGANVNERDDIGWTPLHFAAEKGSDECVESLIVNGADVNASDAGHHIPLHWAAESGSRTSIEYLIQKGSNINERDDFGWTPLHFAARKGLQECVECLIVNGADVNASDAVCQRPLHRAAESGSRHSIEYLIQEGANVNENDDYGWTPLHFAAKNGSHECVECLIVNGADVNARDYNGVSPLHLSVENNHLDSADILVKHGADLSNSSDRESISKNSISQEKGQSDEKNLEILHHENQQLVDILQKPSGQTIQNNNSGQIQNVYTENLEARQMFENVSNVIPEIEATVAHSRGESLTNKRNRKRQRPPKESCHYDGRLISLSNEDIKEIKDACKQDNAVGQGRFGAVFKTFNEGFGIDIAIKKIVADKKEKKNSARKEMFASRILNPFILPLFSTFEEVRTGFQTAREFYFISPYCENGDLYRVLEECRESPDTCRLRLNQMQRMRIALQIALAIQYLHTPVPNVRGIILHKDISSPNIVLDKKFNARLIDFGLARENDDTTTSASGKLHYCHPDVGKPGKSASVAWDYYSLGVVIRELLTGLPPSGNRRVHLRFMNTDDIINNLANIWPTDDDDSKRKANTLNIAAQNCIEAQEGTFCIKTHVIDEIKSEFNEAIMDISGSNKCSLCMINPDGSEAANQITHQSNCNERIRLCIACEKNSFLNPVTCYSCEATLEPIIGYGWGALLVAGNDTDDDDYANAFKADMERVRKMFISRAPLVMGIRTEHVKTVALKYPGRNANTEKLLPLLIKAIEEINETNIHTLVVYFSCHGGTKGENSFQLASKDDKLTFRRLQEMLSSLSKVRKVIVLLDRCYADKLTLPGKVIVQINACGREECAPVQDKGSPFTQYLIKGLQAMSEGKFCEQHCRYCGDYWATRKDYITVGSLLDFIASHMAAKGHPKPRCQFEGNADDVKLAYYTDDEVSVDFTQYEDKNQYVKQVPMAFCQNMDELKMQLLTIYNREKRDAEVCIMNDTYRKENRFETCDTIDKVIMAWVLRKRLIVQFLERGTPPETTY